MGANGESGPKKGNSPYLGAGLRKDLKTVSAAGSQGGGWSKVWGSHSAC